MLVSAGKTALMVFSAATSFRAKAVLVDNVGNKITSAAHMKMLGYTFDGEAGPSLHIKKHNTKNQEQIVGVVEAEEGRIHGRRAEKNVQNIYAVSYTHLTLPTTPYV